MSLLRIKDLSKRKEKSKSITSRFRSCFPRHREWVGCIVSTTGKRQEDVKYELSRFFQVYKLFTVKDYGQKWEWKQEIGEDELKHLSTIIYIYTSDIVTSTQPLHKQRWCLRSYIHIHTVNIFSTIIIKKLGITNYYNVWHLKGGWLYRVVLSAWKKNTNKS